MKMKELTSIDDLKELYNQPVVVIFKHSTRCPISAAAAREVAALEEDLPKGIILTRVLVIEQRDVSLKIADDLLVKHESPQVIVLKDRKVVYSASHYEIKKEAIKAHL